MKCNELKVLINESELILKLLKESGFLKRIKRMVRIADRFFNISEIHFKEEFKTKLGEEKVDMIYLSKTENNPLTIVLDDGEFIHSKEIYAGTLTTEQESELLLNVILQIKQIIDTQEL